MSNPRWLWSWVLLRLDRVWRPVLLVALLVTLLGAGAVIAPADSTMETQHVPDGEVGIEIDAERTAADVDLPGTVTVGERDFVPHTSADGLRVTAWFDPPRRGSADAARNLSVAIETERATGEGTLWHHETRHHEVPHTAGNRTTTSFEVNATALLDRAAAVDAAMGTAGGDVSIRLVATLTGEVTGDADTHRTAVEVRPTRAGFAFDPSAVTTLESPVEVASDDEGPAWWPVGLLGVGLLGVVGAVRVRGSLPLSGPARETHATRVLRHRHRRRVVTVTDPIDLEGAVDVSHRAAIVHLAREARRPLEVDPRGRVAVTVEGTTYVYRPARRLQGG